MDTLLIRKFAYLKTPVYSWSIQNNVGGSFSNSGMKKSRKACLDQVKAQYPSLTFKIVDEIVTGENL
jgi:hypothetical protein